MQKPKILEEIPIKIKTATSIKKKAAKYPENLQSLFRLLFID